MSTLLEDFDYARPKSLGELHQLVTEYQQKGHRFAFAAGGTNLIPHLKTQLYKLDNLISLTGLPELNQIIKQGDHLIIGAMTSLNEVSRHALIRKYLPTLGKAAHKVASPQIRNRATIGGNIMVENRCSYINQSQINRQSHAPCFKADGDICHIVKSAKRGDEVLCQARFVSDTVPVLLLFDTKVMLIGPKGPRKINLHALYLKDGIDSKSLKADEVITSLEIAIPKHTAVHYEKLTIRNALDFPSLGVAVRLTADGDNKALSVALTGLNTHPGYFCVNLNEYDTFDHMVADICEQVMDFAVTYNQDFFPRAYRKDMIPVFIRRGVDQVLKDLNQ